MPVSPLMLYGIFKPKNTLKYVDGQKWENSLIGITTSPHKHTNGRYYYGISLKWLENLRLLKHPEPKFICVDAADVTIFPRFTNSKKGYME